jgi:hypothetical protein
MSRMFKIKTTVLALTLGLSFLGLVAHGEDSIDRQQRFDVALSQYDSGQFQEAAKSYESLLANNHRNGHVLYNLALSYYRAGDNGRSMGAILAARNLLPRNPDVQTNLKFLESKLQDKLSASPEQSTSERLLNFWVGGISVKELFVSNILMGVFAALVLVTAFSLGRLKKYRFVSLWVLAFPVLTMVLLGTKLSLESDWGAVTADGTKVFSGPGVSNTILFNLNTGAPVELSGESNAGFRMVRLSDGKKGWVAESDLAVF